jgi:hypothetical protein
MFVSLDLFAAPYEHGNKSSGFIEDGENTDQNREYQLLTQYSNPFS